jgi:hypothetical protein
MWFWTAQMEQLLSSHSFQHLPLYEWLTSEICIWTTFY